MYSELECGVCYRTYTAGRRCPRELRCKHTFCESCLLALCRAPGAAGAAGSGADIVCPLCRRTTCLSGVGGVRAELRADERVLERLLAAGVPGREEEEEEEEEDGVEDGEEAASPEGPAAESDSSAVGGGGTLRRSWRKVWRKIRGRSRQEGGETDCMTGADLRNMAMMACYMF